MVGFDGKQFLAKSELCSIAISRQISGSSQVPAKSRQSLRELDSRLREVEGRFRLVLEVDRDVSRYWREEWGIHFFSFRHLTHFLVEGLWCLILHARTSTSTKDPSK
jgi:hypothetical protein